MIWWEAGKMSDDQTCPRPKAGLIGCRCKPPFIIVVPWLPGHFWVTKTRCWSG